MIFKISIERIATEEEEADAKSCPFGTEETIAAFGWDPVSGSVDDYILDLHETFTAMLRHEMVKAKTIRAQQEEEKCQKIM